MHGVPRTDIELCDRVAVLSCGSQPLETWRSEAAPLVQIHPEELRMRLFYQSFGVSRGSRDGAYGQLLKRIVDSAAAPGTEVSINGLGPRRALADQYRYLEFIDAGE